METFGKIKDIKFKLVRQWRSALIEYEDHQSMETLKETWSIRFLKDDIRIMPAIFNKEEASARENHVVKIANLPYGTTAYDLDEIMKTVNAKTCIIPRTLKKYDRKRFGYVYFEKDEDLSKATLSNFEFENYELQWVDEMSKTCHLCGDHTHVIKECPEKQERKEKRQEFYKYANVYNKYNVTKHKILTNNNKPSYAEKVKNSTNQTQQINKGDNNKLLDLIKELGKKVNDLTSSITKLNGCIEAIEIKLSKPQIFTSKPQTNNPYESQFYNFQNVHNKINHNKTWYP
nr:10297_t:CDS:1 [Entrophospora candida]